MQQTIIGHLDSVDWDTSECGRLGTTCGPTEKGSSDLKIIYGTSHTYVRLDAAQAEFQHCKLASIA